MPAATPRYKTPRSTIIALVVVVSVVWAVFGLMMVALMSAKGSLSLQYMLREATGWRSVLFVIGFPLFAVLVHLGGKRIEGRFGWGDQARWLMVLSAWFVGGVVMALALWGFRAIGLLQFAWGALIPLGTAFIGFGLQRRIGTELHCAKCGYPFSDEVGPQCPECGSVWSEGAGTIRGRLQRSPVLAGVGALLLVLSFTLTLSPLVARGTINRVVPTKYLIERVVGGDWTGAWAELMSRTLTPEQERALAEGLLDARLAHGRLDRTAEGWLSGLLAAGSLDEELSGRYYREMVVLLLRSRKDEGFVVAEAVAANRSAPFGTTEARIVFGGFAVDGELVDGTRMERFASVYRFDPWSVARKPGESLPSVLVRPQRDRRVVVTAEVWVCYGTPNQLDWGDAWIKPGVPAIPPGLPFVEHSILSIEVEPEG